MVSPAALPIATIGGASQARWLGAGNSFVKPYTRNQDNAIGALQSVHVFSGAEVTIRDLQTGRYALEVAPSFQFSPANAADASTWHQQNKDKHWPFEVVCILTPLDL